MEIRRPWTRSSACRPRRWRRRSSSTPRTSSESCRQSQPHRSRPMQQYVILRRSGWRSPAELEEAAGRSSRVGDEEMPDDIRWIRSYVLEEGGSTVGTVCVYQATSEEAIRKHGELADLPVDEVIPVADTVLVRPDPAPAAA